MCAPAKEKLICIERIQRNVFEIMLVLKREMSLQYTLCHVSKLFSANTCFMCCSALHS